MPTSVAVIAHTWALKLKKVDAYAYVLAYAHVVEEFLSRTVL